MDNARCKCAKVLPKDVESRHGDIHWSAWCAGVGRIRSPALFPLSAIARYPLYPGPRIRSCRGPQFSQWYSCMQNTWLNTLCKFKHQYQCLIERLGDFAFLSCQALLWLAEWNSWVCSVRPTATCPQWSANPHLSVKVTRFCGKLSEFSWKQLIYAILIHNGLKIGS